MYPSTSKAIFWMAALLLLAACGSNESGTKSESGEAATEADARATGEQGSQAQPAPAQQVAQGIQQMARGFQQLATSQGNANVKPVHFRELKKLFPELSGWTLGQVSGEMMNAPFPFSKAEAVYTKGEARIEASIMDSALNQALLAPFSMMVAAGYERESDTGYERGGTVNGNATWEKWRSDQHSGELSVLFEKRYLVKLEGNHLDDLEPLKRLAAGIDFSKLPPPQQ